MRNSIETLKEIDKGISSPEMIKTQYEERDNKKNKNFRVY